MSSTAPFAYAPLSFYFPLATLVFSAGWLSAYFFRNQLLLSLLSLEFLVLSLFVIYLGLGSLLAVCVSVSFYLLVLGACEAALGLCLLVRLVRLLGNDMLGKLNLPKC